MTPDPAIERRRALLRTAAHALRDLHRRLVDEVRGDWERERGPIGSPGALLQLLMTDPFFAWLRPLSSAMAELDAVIDLREPGPEQARAVRHVFESLVASDEGPFADRYRALLQRSPDVILAHAAVRQALRPL